MYSLNDKSVYSEIINRAQLFSIKFLIRGDPLYVVYHEIVQHLQTHKSGNRKLKCTSVPVIVILFPTID